MHVSKECDFNRQRQNGEIYAVGLERGLAPTAEGAGIHGDGGDHAGAGNRGDDGDLHAGSPGDAEVAAGDQARRAVEDRRQNSLLQLGRVYAGQDGDFSLFSWEAYQNFREHTPEFVDLAALQAGNAPLGVRRAGSQAQADTRNGQYVSGNFFRTLGVQPWIGRLMTDADDQEGAPPVAVMSFRIWQEKYGSDPSVIGAGYQINGHPFTVIGVAAPGFYGAKLAGWGMPDFWLPADDGTVD